MARYATLAGLKPHQSLCDRISLAHPQDRYSSAAQRRLNLGRPFKAGTSNVKTNASRSDD